MSTTQTSEVPSYEVNGHHFHVVSSFDAGETVECRECLIREFVKEGDDPDEYLELMTQECHIEWLWKPDGDSHGTALRNGCQEFHRDLIAVKEDDGLEVVDSIRVYDDDAPALAGMLDNQAWSEAESYR